MKHLLYIAFLLPLIGFSQSYFSNSRNKGEVFKRFADNPSEDINKTGLIVVTLKHPLVFEDDQIPKAYKKMVERFFNQVFYNEYKKQGTKYRLKVEKREFGNIYIEGIKVGNIKEVPTS